MAAGVRRAGRGWDGWLASFLALRPRQGRLSAFTCVSAAEMELVWRLNETVYMIVLRKV